MIEAIKHIIKLIREWNKPEPKTIVTFDVQIVSQEEFDKINKERKERINKR